MRKFIFFLIVSFTAFSQADSSVTGGNRTWESRTYRDNADEYKFFSYNSVLIPFESNLEHAYDIHRNRYFKLFARDTFKVRSLAPDKAISSNPTYVVGHGADTILHSYVLESFIVPSVRSLTINGNTQNLGANRTWTLSTSDISEGNNKYFTDPRVRSAISISNTGLGGNATYDVGTGNFNIPLIPTNTNQLTNGAGFVPQTRTLTINGTSFDLSSSRTFNVGDLLSTGSYSNPTWLTSLSDSKINWSGTSLQYIRGDGQKATFPTIDSYSQGFGINITGTSPNKSVSINTTDVMTVSRATDSIANLNTKINSKITVQDARNSLSAGTGISYNASTGVITNSSPNQVVSLTAGNGITITGTYPNFTISTTAPTITNASGRSLNSNFTVSSTKPATVFYAIQCSATNPVLAGTSSVNVFLEYSTDSGANWLGAIRTGNSSSVAVSVTVQLTNSQVGLVGGVIPANALVRLRSAVTGTASATYIGGQEVIY